MSEHGAYRITFAKPYAEETQAAYVRRLLDAANNDVWLTLEEDACVGDLLVTSPIIITCEILSEQGPSHVPAKPKFATAQAIASYIERVCATSPHSDCYTPLLAQYIDLLHPRVCLNAEKEKRETALMLTMVSNVLQGGNFVDLLGIGSFFDHRCIPNVVAQRDNFAQIYEFTALTMIPAGDRLCISYAPFPIDDFDARAQHIVFNCACDICAERRVPSRVMLDELPIEVVVHFLREPEHPHCWHCGRDAQLVCKQCSLARYCSATCVGANYELVHKDLCEDLRREVHAFKAYKRQMERNNDYKIL